MKILYLINHAGKAGTEAYVYSMAQRVPGMGSVPALGYNERGLLVERIEELGLKTFQLKMRHPFDLVAAYRLAKICRAENIDIVHAQFLRENYISMLSRLFRPKTKTFYTSHFIMGNSLPIRICNRLISPLQTAVISVCTIGKTQLTANGVDPRKIEIIFNGVDPDYWGKREVSTVREEFNITEEKTILFCGSRFAHDKGHKYLLEAFSIVRTKAPGRFALVLSNDGPLFEDVKKQALDMGAQEDIIFTGPRKDMKNMYDGADIYLNPSEHEALSFAIIEALAEGLPVIATNMGGNPDIINEDTKCGLLVEYNDPSGLADAILRLSDDPELREELRSNAAKAVREKFNVDIMARKTYNLYVNALK